MQHSKSMLISVANQSQCEFLKRIITMLYLLDIPLIGSSNLLVGEQQSPTQCKSYEPPAFHRNIPPQHIHFVISCMCDQSSMCLNARVKSYCVHRQMVTPLFQHHLPLPPFKKNAYVCFMLATFSFAPPFFF